ncbi:hypothetical protein LCGC14_2502860, partial [marine sediment metagenome]
ANVMEAHPEILEQLSTIDAPQDQEEHDEIKDLVGTAEEDDE